MIVWLEDREETIRAELDLMRKLGIRPYVYSSPESMVSFLEEMADEGHPRPILIVLDVMIYGTLDLSGVDIPNAPTTGGTEAGYVFAERFLRRPDGPWSDIPIAFYTEADPEHIREAADNLRGEADLGEDDCVVFQKLNDADFTAFETLVKRVIGGS